MSIIENIQHLCKGKNISIPKLEKEFGFGHGAIYRWQTNSPSVDKLQKVADYFNVTIDSLLAKTIITDEELNVPEPKGSYIVMDEKDRGKGIPPQVLKRLSDFYISK